MLRYIAFAALTVLLGACDGGKCDQAKSDSCGGGQVCEAIEGGDPKCLDPILVKGKVVNAADLKGIDAARVAGRDESGAVLGKVAVSAADGAYELPLSARRNKDGAPLATLVTLRADAKGYVTYPGGVRPAIPIDLATATQKDGKYVVENAATTVGLFALASAAGTGTVRGKVEATSPGGVLVVAGGKTGVADLHGDFAIFNVPAGAASVRGYAANLQLTPVDVTVPADGEVKDVVLKTATTALGKVSGGVNIVNAPGGALTSVVLVLEETFNATLEIGEVPRGLRASGVSNDFEIAGVPDGKYVILASLDNDGLVRDPDPNISGTQIVHLEVVNGVPSVTGTNFKVTEALAIRSPGASGVEDVTGTPTFKWADDSSEEGYQLKVYDAMGNLVWEKLDVPKATGGDVSVAYGGPALTVGMVYQFRATSMKTDKTGAMVPISRTEELRGVFTAR